MDASHTPSPFLTFAVGGQAYAMPLARVREVVSCKTVVRVPNAGAALRGLMNLRGNVIAVVDLSLRLGGSETVLCETTCAVLIETAVDGEQTAIAGLVEEIRGVVDLAGDAITTTPPFGTPIDPRLVRGVANGEGKSFAYVLDPDEVFAGTA